MKSRLYSIFAAVGTLTALCLHTTSLEAVFASVKSVGMGGAAVSYPLDTLSGAYNPAGLIDVGDRIDIEAAWVRDGGSATITNTLPNPIPPYTPPLFVKDSYNGMRTTSVYPVNAGFNKNWQIGCSDWTISTGIILYNREYQKTTYKKIITTATTPPYPVGPLLGVTKPGLEYLSETVSPIIGLKWRDTHMIAVSADYQVERLKVNGAQNLIPLSIHPDQVTNRGYNWSTGWGFSIGYLGHITPCLSIGATFAPRVTMRHMDKYKGFLAGGKIDLPQRIDVGISYRILPCLVVAFDAEHLQWSKVRALHNPLYTDAATETFAPVGSNDGPGFGFSDQWFYRVGLEWTINESFVARIGYRYANSPIRKSQTFTNLLTLDTVESYILAGGTWNITECQELSIVGGYGFQNKIKGENSIPNTRDVPLGGGNIALKEQKWAIGLAWAYKY